MKPTRCLAASALAAALLLAPGFSWSDGPLGFGEPLGRFAEGLGFVLILEPLVVVGEALAYIRFAGLRALRAFGTSLLANVASYCIGVLAWILLSVALSGTFASREARWALGLPLTLLVEVPIVIGANLRAADHRRLRTCAIWANCASYLLVWLIVDTVQR